MNVRLTILLAVVALMIGATWAIIEFTDVVFREDPDPDEPWLYHIDETDITFIEVIHDGNGVQYERDSGSHQWRIIGDPDYPVFQQKWGGTPLLLSGPRVNRGLKETINDPAQYGLDPPESIVRVADWAGNTFEFHMGIPTPDGGNQYARLVGDDALFTVPAVWADVVNRLADEPPYGRLFDLELPEIWVVEVEAKGSAAVYFVEGDRWLVHSGKPPVDPETSPPVLRRMVPMADSAGCPARRHNCGCTPGGQGRRTAGGIRFRASGRPGCDRPQGEGPGGDPARRRSHRQRQLVCANGKQHGRNPVFDGEVAPGRNRVPGDRSPCPPELGAAHNERGGRFTEHWRRRIEQLNQSQGEMRRRIG